IAAHAASFTTAGAGKSGNPCERLTPPYIWLRRVISRMTDSVNWVAFFDPVNLDMSGRRLNYEEGTRNTLSQMISALPAGTQNFLFRDKLRFGAIQPTVIFRRTQDPLHVVLRFRVRNIVDELIA